MTREHMRGLQAALAGLGHDPGPADGLWGPKTAAAVLSLHAAAGKPPAAPAPDHVTDLPWMIEAKRVLGRHETRDNSLLRKWLKSDGKTLGDPAQLPWCGDFVETCIRLALPAEPLPGALGQNPYWARNWALLGHETAPTYGAVLVFSRDGGGGHVGFCMGADASAYHVLGGNQSNAVTVARISRGRLLSARWPATHPARSIHLPALSASGSLSANEA